MGKPLRTGSSTWLVPPQLAPENEDQGLTWRLDDGSGIEYLWVQKPGGGNENLGVEEGLTGTGEVLKVERDLLAGQITATVRLSAWNTRD